MSRSRFMVPATLALAAGLAAALAGCSSSPDSPRAYGSDEGFGAGDRFGAYLFVNPPKSASTAAAQPAPQAKSLGAAKAQPATGASAKANPAKTIAPKVTTAKVTEQNAD
ncbi:MAG: hypothetical protein IT434_17545 [Phycisphaerales bacterium]|nr:hypothetical protein [Phycisphaerales bacterium]